jgi:hypothetical protein
MLLLLAFSKADSIARIRMKMQVMRFYLTDGKNARIAGFAPRSTTICAQLALTFNIISLTGQNKHIHTWFQQMVYPDIRQSMLC